MKVLIYFSNPPTSPVHIPFKDIHGTLMSKRISSSMFFKSHVCSGKEINENIYNKLESNNHCGNRELCTVCSERRLKMYYNKHIDQIYFSPCVDRFISIIMGPENTQEEQYPSRDKFKNEDLFKKLTIFGERMKKFEKICNHKNTSIPPHNLRLSKNSAISTSLYLITLSVLLVLY